MNFRDYSVSFTTAQRERMKQIFSQGVCDYSRKGVRQHELAGTWVSFGPARPDRDDDDDDDD